MPKNQANTKRVIEEAAGQVVATWASGTTLRLIAQTALAIVLHWVSCTALIVGLEVLSSSLKAFTLELTRTLREHKFAELTWPDTLTLMAVIYVAGILGNWCFTHRNCGRRMPAASHSAAMLISAVALFLYFGATWLWAIGLGIISFHASFLGYKLYHLLLRHKATDLT